MSAGYKAIQWSRHKRVYDAAIGAGVSASVLVFFVIGRVAWGEGNSDVQLAIRALGLTAIVLLHVVLAIGPLARLDPRFLPALFNRRHLGVTTFLVGLAHAALSVVFYHGGGVVNPLVSALMGGPGGGSPGSLPSFEVFGAGALLILFLLAATSHDFWLKNLGNAWWKRLHMLVYVAYALLVLHVCLGVLQSERSLVFPAMLAIGAGVLAGLHIVAGRREVRRDRIDRAPTDRSLSAAEAAASPDLTIAAEAASSDRAWVDACAIEEIPEGRARPCPVRHADGRVERVAVFRYPLDGKLVVSATTNVCAHQGGPLGEGKVIDGCATCPWHGWQYRPHDGCAPPPFTERIPTYRVRVLAGRVQVDPTPLPPGTPVPPAILDAAPLTAEPDRSGT